MSSPTLEQAQIDGNTKLMGVLGEDIGFTMSPRLHNRAAKALGINACYLAVPLPEADVAGFLRVAWSMGAVGFSVTTPHKEHVASLLTGSSLKSVNTLYRGTDGWQGTSTDAEGFVRGLRRLDLDFFAFEKLVLLGAGGAVLAILEHLGSRDTGVKEVVVLRRDGARDARLKSAVGGRSLRCESLSVDALTSELKGRGADTLLVQATNGPRRGDDLATLVPALKAFEGVMVDLIYGKPSALYFAAVAKNLTVQDGEPMLIEQARLAQDLWWGKSASYDLMAAALRGK